MKTKSKLLSPLAALGVMFVLNAQAGQGPQPSICNRGCWAARAPWCSISQMGALTRAIVHHTAGASDWTTDYETGKSKVRGVQNIHMDGNGWCDIGYHFLLNAGGHIYEGRSGSMSSLPKGSHDCANGDSFGFTVMGYYHPTVSHTFTTASMNALMDTIAWRMPSAWSPYGSSSYGTCEGTKTVGFLDGHRKVVGTACPGDGIYNSYITDNRNAGPIRDGVNARKNNLRRKFDFNGDGKSDVATFLRGGTPLVYVALSSGGSFGNGQQWSSAFCSGTEIPLVGDFNGDGRADIITFVRGTGAPTSTAGDVWVSLSTGTAFGGNQKWHDYICVGSEVPCVGDINGDGKDDIISFQRGSPANEVWVALSTGGGFGAALRWHTSFCLAGEVPEVADVNGDGKSDIITFQRGTSADVWVALSTGSSFGIGAVKWHEYFAAGTEVPAVGDFNGDGKADIATFTRGGLGYVYVALSSGANFGNGQLWHSFFCGYNNELPGVGDFNGDGKADIATFLRGTGTPTTWVGDIYVALSGGAGFGSGIKWHDYFCAGAEIPQPGPNAALSW